MYYEHRKEASQQGFSLIEFLVVIVIVGILSSFVFASLVVARRKARDSVRISEKNQIIRALKTAYIDLGGWPVSNGGGTQWSCLQKSGTCWGGGHSADASLYAVLEKYINPVPVPNAVGANAATNAYLYIQNHPSSPPTVPNIGAHLLWMQEREIKQKECPGSPPQHYDAYWYCYEFLGL
ncbi:MAG: Uncharacterized protein G01um101448_592 [Parcubacteria group bacterium Gr01-1014_48]|nr:MAG: Uncharacterized protein Greene041614_1212 [Parcubacteria group bacterium Greene0416_14]TSC73703.1 MAG: Uncharacterized protein G01um101448_592 [Parcubacteria group bacterium Gr01-1014_48]TSC98971.1 MAG: Uncharacterized protein Greene101415_1209 [Parcubacteria group bacterium Greene1014_15]TSD06896.1 MAG: Uncharacterized protein Greene07144_1083 [Parcubacteria group bacterium Greene0714_4]